jgi:hypothetical protein
VVEEVFDDGEGSPGLYGLDSKVLFHLLGVDDKFRGRAFADVSQTLRDARAGNDIMRLSGPFHQHLSILPR